MTSERTKKICKRCGILCLEICAVLVAAFLAGTLYLSWTLSKGPLDISFLVSHLEQGFTYPDKGIQLKLGDANLEWSSLESSPQIRVHNVEIRKIDGPPIAIISELGITIAIEELLRGRLVANTVTVFEPALKIYRTKEGRFAFNIGKDVRLIPDNQDADLPKDTEFMTQLLTGMSSEGDEHILGGEMKQLSIVNAWLAFENRETGTRWVSPRTDILVNRDESGIVVQSRLDLEMTEDSTTNVQARLFYNRESGTSKIIGTFKDVDPAALSQKNPIFDPLKHLVFILHGSLNMHLDQNFMPVEALVTMNGDNGKLDLPMMYDAPVPVKSTALELHYSLRNKALDLRNFLLDLDGPKAVIRGRMRLTAEEQLESNLEAELTDMPIDNLDQHWPHKLAQAARRWVTENLTVGTATKATLTATGTAPLRSPLDLNLEELGGEIEFHDLTVNYLSPMPKVTGVSGKATYTQKEFGLKLDGGIVENMTVTGSDIMISNFDYSDGPHTKIDIDVSLNGPVQAAMRILDSDPLNYTSKLGIEPDKTGGATDIDVNFKFPLHNKLSMDEVHVSAKAELRDILFADLIAGLAVTGGPLQLGVDRSEMTVSGTAQLAGTPTRFSWVKNFDKEAKTQSRIEAALNLNKQMRGHFGVDFEDWILGDELPVNIVHTLYSNKQETLFARGNGTATILALPELGYMKPRGQQAEIEAMVHLKNRKPERVSDIKITSDELHIEGQVNLAPNATVSYINFPTFKMGKTDTALEGEAKLDGGFEYLFKGMTLDASTLFEKTPGPKDFRKPEPPQQVQPVSIAFELSNLITGPDRGFYDVKAFVRRNRWSRIEQLEIDGQTGGGDIYARYLPDENGNHTLRFEAANAGAALRALDITDVIDGGVLVVSGRPRTNGGPRDLVGSLSLNNFRVVNMPLLARILNGLSLSGMGELLSGRGIAFKKLRSNYVWTDTVWAAGQSGKQHLAIKDGRTSGASLGLTVEGSVNYITDQYDIHGTIIPISGVNKLIGGIPLVGDILTGGTDAVFAATYTIKGPSTEPTITVNPLAALAPGLLRKILFED